jgi:AcrR family transcriptional regulator
MTTPTRPGLATTHRRVLDAAARVFAERGFHATTKELIGAAAGYSHQTVRDHFRTLDELLAVIVAEGWREVRGSLVRADASPVDRLLAAFDALDALARTRPAEARCVLHEASVAGPFGAPLDVEEQRAFYAAVERIVMVSTGRGDAPARAAALIAALEGLMRPLVVPWFDARMVYSVSEARRAFRTLAEALLA